MCKMEMTENESHRDTGPLNENGAALVISLMFLAILAMLGTTAVIMTTTDMQIGNNYKTNTQASNAAQSGIAEARQRLRSTSAIRITDSSPTDPNWETYIGTDALAQNLPQYDSGDPITASIHDFTDLDYAVQIRHLAWEDPPGSGTYVVVYWGDDGVGYNRRNKTDGKNIYEITSYGISTNGGNATNSVEVTQAPPVNPVAALYVEGPVDVNSENAEVDGYDNCGGSNNLPGVATTESMVSADDPVHDQHESITGNPNVQYDVSDLSIQEVIDTYKSMADYTVSGGNYSWENWGSPTGTPLTPDCSESNIVYVSGNIKLMQSTGCGILLVDGNLDAQAGFQWYGIVFVSGCLKYTGNAASDGIYGAVFCGSSCESDITGNVKLHYCSAGVQNAVSGLPFRTLSWKDE